MNLTRLQSTNCSRVSQGQWLGKTKRKIIVFYIQTQTLLVTLGSYICGFFVFSDEFLAVNAHVAVKCL